jgi:pantoate--beta-alanine ligase
VHLEQASGLNTVLFGMAERLAREPDAVEAVRDGGRERLEALGFAEIDYLDIRDAETLATIDRLERPARILTAVRLGGARLLDNVPVEPIAPAP